MDVIRGIIFDKDGTLFDFRSTWESWCTQVISRISGGDTGKARDVASAIGFDMDQGRFEHDSIVIAGTVDEIAAAVAPFVDDIADIPTFLNTEAAAAPQVEAVPLSAFLIRLKDSGYRLGVATNDGIDPTIAHLKEAKVYAHFDMVMGYDSGFGGKPQPGQLLAFAKAMQMSPSECLMVGDSLTDMVAAQNAGMSAVAVLTGMADTDDLTPFARAVLPDIGHLPKWLEDQRTG